MTVFISIVSYRDPQLAATLADCIGKARYPHDLRFGICWQHGSSEPPLPVFDDPRFRVDIVPWDLSAGVCWARSRAMTFWDGEEFYAQFDSHHRFVEGWDEKLIRSAHRTSSSKPLLSAFGSAFDPESGMRSSCEPTAIEIGGFEPDGLPKLQAYLIENWRECRSPIRARFICTHFLFTLGTIVSEVPYDPSLYYLGEEITMGARAFMAGYDLFHPVVPILWHQYTRQGMPKHWDDHVLDTPSSWPWYRRDKLSRAKVRRFLFGATASNSRNTAGRSFHDYEDYCGVNFLHRHIRTDAQTREAPSSIPGWSKEVARQKVVVNVDWTILQNRQDNEGMPWQFRLHAEDGAIIWITLVSHAEAASALAGRSISRIECRFTSDRRPVAWSLARVSGDEHLRPQLFGPCRK